MEFQELLDFIQTRMRMAHDEALQKEIRSTHIFVPSILHWFGLIVDKKRKVSESTDDSSYPIQNTIYPTRSSMLALLKKVKGIMIGIINKMAIKPVKCWAISQDYEFKSAITFMKQESFIALLNDLVAGKQKISNGYASDLLLKEFFDSSRDEWQEFMKFIEGKRCLDIGPCIFSPLSSWDIASQKYVIEPLYEKVNEWQKLNLGHSAFESMICFGEKAEVIIPELVGQIDGAIYCRNMLDHTPTWPWILSNISSYATVGCKLLFWCDLDHKGTADSGHYDITSDIESFKRLIIQFGFKIIREYQDEQRFKLNWGCFAEKTS